MELSERNEEAVIICIVAPLTFNYCSNLPLLQFPMDPVLASAS